MLAAVSWVPYTVFRKAVHADTRSYVYIDRDDTSDSLYRKLESLGQHQVVRGMRIVARFKGGAPVPTGRYQLYDGDHAWALYQRVFRGHQSPVRLAVSSARSMEAFAGKVAHQLMIDSVEIVELLHDSAFCAAKGYTPDTRMSMIVPNTYEVYWNIGAEALINRLLKERDAFWNDDRMRKASELGLTTQEVCTLASIVDEESNMSNEKPIIAGLYLNRLRRGMPLQADPTVKFAMGDASIRRITRDMLEVESPYNTYLHAGLPPGPIRIASIKGIDGVLNYAQHNYLYMCAKEDFSGYHNFAATHSEHMRNARRYWNALNKRKIFK